MPASTPPKSFTFRVGRLLAHYAEELANEEDHGLAEEHEGEVENIRPGLAVGGL